MKCAECYSDRPRATPLRGIDDCLRNHRQYICSRCGRLICADMKGERRARCFMPFGSPGEALLYLRAAEVLSGGVCAVWALIYGSGDTRYRIFPSGEIMRTFLRANPAIRAASATPVMESPRFAPCGPEQLRYLNGNEIARYIAGHAAERNACPGKGAC